MIFLYRWCFFLRFIGTSLVRRGNDKGKIIREFKMARKAAETACNKMQLLNVQYNIDLEDDGSAF